MFPCPASFPAQHLMDKEVMHVYKRTGMGRKDAVLPGYHPLKVLGPLTHLCNFQGDWDLGEPGPLG